jgi:hypothetical protein
MVMLKWLLIPFPKKLPLGGAAESGLIFLHQPGSGLPEKVISV